MDIESVYNEIELYITETRCQMIKLSRERLRKLSQQIMYLEYYWSIYLKTHHQSDFKHHLQIETFIQEQKYDSLLNVRYTRFTKKAIMSDAQLRELHRYANICTQLQKKMGSDAT